MGRLFLHLVGVMFLGVVLVIVVMMARTCCIYRLKDFLHCSETDLLPIQHLPNCNIVLHEKASFLDGCGKVEVSNLPCDGGCFLAATESNQEDWLCFLLDYIGSPGISKYGLPVLQWRFQIEAEISSILGSSAPSPFAEDMPRDDYRDLWQLEEPVFNGVTNGVHN